MWAKAASTSQEQQSLLLKVKRVTMQQKKSSSSDVSRNVCLILSLTFFCQWKWKLWHKLIIPTNQETLTFFVTALTVSSIISQLSRPEHTFFSFIIAQPHLLSLLPLFERPPGFSFSVFEKVFVVQRKSQVVPVFTRLLLSVFLDSLSLYIFAIYLPNILMLRLYTVMLPVSFLSSLCIE